MYQPKTKSIRLSKSTQQSNSHYEQTPKKTTIKTNILSTSQNGEIISYKKKIITTKSTNFPEKTSYKNQSYSKIIDEYQTEKTLNKKILLPKEKLKKRPKSPDPSDLKIKTINRGENFDNIQVTHVILTKHPAEFHIFDNLSNIELSSPMMNLEENRKKLEESQINGKISITCSCDNFDIKPIEKNLKGKITIFQHCGGVGMTDLEKELISSNFYTSGIKEIPIRRRKKNEPKIEYVENWREHDENILPDKRFNFILKTNPNVEKKPPKPDDVYNINVKITQRSNNFQRNPVKDKIKNASMTYGNDKVYVSNSVRRFLESYDELDVKRMLRHYLMRFKNNAKLIQESDPITNITYVSWFNRHNNDTPFYIQKQSQKN